MLCGGWIARKECHEYKIKDQSWSKAPYSLITERSEAAGATMENGSWLIIGGKGMDGEPVSTSESLEGKIFRPNLLWPEVVSGHCVKEQGRI